eukprot:TRINITY_DN1895_c0_g1_i2.p1 TRINITY_DN1895_c0_g1~~TRINITY_DN1895_c0_g1_i2.p1  ORF type:complete len:119 (+),score=30.66 TRINITY_DN1895_c0_g1_i2:111-467(+)
MNSLVVFALFALVAVASCANVINLDFSNTLVKSPCCDFKPFPTSFKTLDQRRQNTPIILSRRSIFNEIFSEISALAFRKADKMQADIAGLCGNMRCEPTENCNSCAVDCGSCGESDQF